MWLSSDMPGAFIANWSPPAFNSGIASRSSICGQVLNVTAPGYACIAGGVCWMAAARRKSRQSLRGRRLGGGIRTLRSLHTCEGRRLYSRCHLFLAARGPACETSSAIIRYKHRQFLCYLYLCLFSIWRGRTIQPGAFSLPPSGLTCYCHLYLCSLYLCLSCVLLPHTFPSC